MNDKKCNYCGKRYKHYRKSSRFCCMDCYVKFTKENGSLGKPRSGKYVKEYTCKTCGDKFRRFSKTEAYFCCMDCYTKHRDGKETIKCKNCGKESVSYKGNKKIYCNSICRNEFYKQYTGKDANSWKGGLTKESQLFRTSSKYKSMRKRVLERDNYMCQKCGYKSKKGLHVHHKIHFSKDVSLRLEDTNCITLCKECHQLEHPNINLCKRKTV